MMKQKSFLIIIRRAIIFVLWFGCCFVAKAQTISQNGLLRESDFPMLMSEVKTNKSLQIERLSAYYFHQLINKYRIEKKTTTLYWDERLWLAARNHNLYQAGIADIDHTEQVKNDFFSGKQPEDRVKFVTYNMEEIDGIGENVLYNYDKDGETVEEIALNIAKAAFLQWKNSPPHNANMLDDAYFSHGTSLYISNDGKVFGTTVFAFKYEFEEQEITLHWDTAMAKRNPSLFVKDGKSYDKLDRNSSSDEKKLLTLVKKKMPSAKKSLDKGMQIAAQKQLNYLKSGNEKEKNSTPKKRYLKATKYKTLLYVLTHKIQEKSFNIFCTEAEIKNKSVFAKIEKELQTQFSQRNKIQKWGAAVAIIEKDKQFQIIIDVVWVGLKK
ncbi:MAG: CAP domain-containing protein [Bacteroidota bacterium]